MSRIEARRSGAPLQLQCIVAMCCADVLNRLVGMGGLCGGGSVRAARKVRGAQELKRHSVAAGEGISRAGVGEARLTIA